MRLAHCIECGCHDLAACCDEAAQGPCSWLELDRDDGKGVCSACPEAVERWKAGDRTFAVPVGNAIENLGTAIERALVEAPVSDVLSVLTGAFVGLTVEVVRRQGHDVAKAITVDGGAQRDITIHPPKQVTQG